MKIAILVDEQGTVLPFFSSGIVVIYSDETGEWKRVNRIPHDMSGELTMNAIRLKAGQFILQLDDCNQVIFKNAIGIAKPILEEYNIGIWVYKGELSISLLDHIRIEVKTKLAEQALIVPEPSLQGYPEELIYKLDICHVDNCGEESEAREVLISFFQHMHFRELTVLCREKLIWLKAFSELLQLNMTIKLLPDEVWKLTIVPEDFENGLSHRRLIKLSQMPGHEDCSTCSSTDSCISEQIKSQMSPAMP